MPAPDYANIRPMSATGGSSDPRRQGRGWQETDRRRRCRHARRQPLDRPGQRRHAPAAAQVAPRADRPNNPRARLKGGADGRRFTARHIRQHRRRGTLRGQSFGDAKSAAALFHLRRSMDGINPDQTVRRSTKDVDPFSRKRTFAGMPYRRGGSAAGKNCRLYRGAIRHDGQRPLSLDGSWWHGI